MLGSSRSFVLQGVEIRTHEAAKRAASELTAILGQKVTVGTSVDTLDNNQICLLYKCCSCLKPRIARETNIIMFMFHYYSKAKDLKTI